MLDVLWNVKDNSVLPDIYKTDSLLHLITTHKIKYKVQL